MKLMDRKIKLSGGVVLQTLLTAICLVFVCGAAAGQTGKERDKPPPFVKLNVIVTDASGQAVTDLNQADFQILEDGVPQTIEAFARREGPLCYGLAIDNSGSLRSSIEEVLEAARFTVAQNNPDDESFVVRFVNRDKIETVQDFSSDRALLDKSLETLHVDEGQSGILDAVYDASNRIAKYKRKDSMECRRALVLMTDGEDRASFYRLDQLFAHLRGFDMPIFSIGFTKVIKNPRGHTFAVGLLSRLARETGGNAFFYQKRSDLIPIGKEIMAEMRAPYIISYTSTNAARDGLDRTLQVTVREAPGRGKLLVQARRLAYKAPVK